MTKWSYLAAAVVFEVAGSLSLRAAVDHPAWYLLVAVGYVAAFLSLTLLLKRGAPLGVVYGIWGASGVALTAVMSALIFGETLTAVMLTGIALVIAGVLVVELGSQHATAKHEQAV